ncbi:DUF1801 domain-containing protein [Pseudomonas sp. MMS21-TM103]|uniref:DUF1801 domain-containing protein n=1 Tax=Pseudomonas sp. MMS21 TM103 TaxID=2886506 RepID=UPI001EDF2D7A|nr:DUF1801 domain-containing protein [Pseudomonas sp. MMS21 TM103]MCG4453912.1 DUF1801 domain-containing protein [Pseudomonas sp. MMS21 TM103]
MKNPDSSENRSASELIDARIAELGDWRGCTLSRMRGLIKEAVPEIIEQWKWMGTPVWSQGGIICTSEVYKSKVKLTFAKGTSLDDPSNRMALKALEGETFSLRSRIQRTEQVTV